MDLASIALMEPKPGPIPTRSNWVAELKYDGYRILAGRAGGQVQLRSRGRHDFTARYPGVVQALADLPGSWVIDAEACVVDENGIPRFRAMQRARQTVVLFVFDILFKGSRDIRKLPLLERKALLRRLVPQGHKTIGYVDYIEGGPALYAYAVQIGMEGIVSKLADSAYRGGITDQWIKTVQPGWKH
jgi:bifunctional non-homologous end joining protein LigD